MKKYTSKLTSCSSERTSDAFADSETPDQTAPDEAAEIGLHCLLLSFSDYLFYLHTQLINTYEKYEPAHKLSSDKQCIPR